MPELTPDLVLLIAAAFITSALSACLGMAGGVSLLAVMSSVMSNAIVIPIHGLVQWASNLTRALVFFKHVNWTIMAHFAPLALLGSFAAIHLFRGQAFPGFKLAIGLLIVGFLIIKYRSPKLPPLPMRLYTVLGLAAGAVGVLVGATGPFLAPFFLRDDLTKDGIIATAAAAQMVVHTAKLAAFVYIGFNFVEHAGTILPLLVAVFLGTISGKRLLALISELWFRRIFMAILGVLAARLVYLGVADVMK